MSVSPAFCVIRQIVGFNNKPLQASEVMIRPTNLETTFTPPPLTPLVLLLPLAFPVTLPKTPSSSLAIGASRVERSGWYVGMIELYNETDGQEHTDETFSKTREWEWVSKRRGGLTRCLFLQQ